MLAVPSKLTTWTKKTILRFSKVGELPYKSKITHKMEKLPVSVGLMSLQGLDSSRCVVPELTILTGTDLMLMETVQKILEHSGRPTSVKTGKLMFTSSEAKLQRK